MRVPTVEPYELVPPVPLTVTTAVPPAHGITGVVALAVTGVGSAIVIVVVIEQLLWSDTVYVYVPALTVNVPVPVIVPVPPVPVTVTTVVPP